MLVQCGKIRPLPIVLVGERYWRRAVDFDFLVRAGTIAARDRRLFRYADTAGEAWSAIAPSLAPAGPAPKRS